MPRHLLHQARVGEEDERLAMRLLDELFDPFHEGVLVLRIARIRHAPGHKQAHLFS